MSEHKKPRNHNVKKVPLQKVHDRTTPAQMPNSVKKPPIVATQVPIPTPKKR